MSYDEEFECEECEWSGYARTYTCNENTDADGRRGMMVKYYVCGNAKCGHEVGYQQGW